MKVFRLFCILMVTVTLLSACATDKPASATETPADIVYVTPDASMATPAVGYATVVKMEGVSSVLLHSQPEIKAPLSGQVYPNEEGALLGVDSTGKWVLVRIKDQTGWAPFQLFYLTIAQ